MTDKPITLDDIQKAARAERIREYVADDSRYHERRPLTSAQHGKIWIHVVDERNRTQWGVCPVCGTHAPAKLSAAAAGSNSEHWHMLCHAVWYPVKNQITYSIGLANRGPLKSIAHHVPGYQFGRCARLRREIERVVDGMPTTTVEEWRTARKLTAKKRKTRKAERRAIVDERASWLTYNAPSIMLREHGVDIMRTRPAPYFTAEGEIAVEGIAFADWRRACRTAAFIEHARGREFEFPVYNP